MTKKLTVLLLIILCIYIAPNAYAQQQFVNNDTIENNLDSSSSTVRENCIPESEIKCEVSQKAYDEKPTGCEYLHEDIRYMSTGGSMFPARNTSEVGWGYHNFCKLTLQGFITNNNALVTIVGSFAFVSLAIIAFVIIRKIIK